MSPKKRPRDGLIVTLAGIRGSGKTTKLYELIQPCRRILVGDPEGRFRPEPFDYELIFGATNLERRLLELGATNPAVPFRIVYRDLPEPMRIMAPATAFAVQRCTCVLDELKWFCSAQHVPPHLQSIISFGREPEINLLGTTRNPQEINDMLLSQADLVYLFHMEEGLGLERCKRFFPKQAPDLPTLKRHEYRLRVSALGLTERALLDRLGREGT